MSDELKARTREALRGITTGPWRACPAPNGRGQRVTNKDGVTLFVNERHGQARAKVDARFIAATPELVRDLLAALEATEARIERVDAVAHLIPKASTDFGDGWVEAMGFVVAALKGGA